MVMIEYNIYPNRLDIYLDTTETFLVPVISVDSLDLSRLLELELGEGAYVGITSATGDACENHYILSWWFCPQPTDGPITSTDYNISAEKYNSNAFPNPANENTTIKYTLDEPAFVRITLYSAMGNEIETNTEQYRSTGEHITVFNTENLPPGLYFYKIQIGERLETGKLIIVR